MSVIEYALEARVNGVIVHYKLAETTAEIQDNLSLAEESVEAAVKEQEAL